MQMFSGEGKTGGRRPFKMSTKKIEWMDAAGRGIFDKFCKTSKCRRCKRKLTWGDGSYDFDHRNNNSANRSQENCYLVCKICHGKVTKPKIKIYEHVLTGHRIYERKMEKVGYKKGKRAKTTKAKTKSTKPKLSKTKAKTTAKSKSSKAKLSKTKTKRTKAKTTRAKRSKLLR